jgi:hypothetical protein
MLRAIADASERRYVSLDEFGPRSLAIEDPALFVQRYPAPVLVDEIQHAPALLQHLKAEVDRSAESGRYWLTGSQQFPLLQGVSESLAGRVGLLRLDGLSTSEEQQTFDPQPPFRPDRLSWRPEQRGSGLLDVFERVVRGSMPRMIHQDAPPWEAFYGSYVQTYIERDVRSMLSIADLAAFQRFLKLTAARCGQLVNYSDLARDTGVAVSTAREWLHVLEVSSQLVLLRPYYQNLSSRQIKTPKLYFMDTGLAAFLAGWKSAETAVSGAMAGALFETHIVAELHKSYRHRGVDPPLYFWRDKERREVDLIIAEDGQLFPIEVKLAGAPTRRDLRGIEAIQKLGAPVGPGALIAPIAEPYPLTKKVTAIPPACIR